MDQERRIRELEEYVLRIERRVVKQALILDGMDRHLRPMYLDWKEQNEEQDMVSRMVLYG